MSERNRDKVKRLEHELGRYQKKVGELMKANAKLREDMKGLNQLRMAFDAWLNNIKANLLREVADLYDTLQTRHNDHYSRRDPALWLHYEADRFEEAPMADEYVPTT